MNQQLESERARWGSSGKALRGPIIDAVRKLGLVEKLQCQPNLDIGEDREMPPAWVEKSVTTNAWAAVTSIGYFENDPDQYLSLFGITLDEAQQLKQEMYGK